VPVDWVPFAWHPGTGTVLMNVIAYIKVVKHEPGGSNRIYLGLSKVLAKSSVQIDEV
jgi:hypothetical protein